MNFAERRKELIEEVKAHCLKNGMCIKSRKAFSIAHAMALMEKMFDGCEIECGIDELTMRDFCIICRSDVMEIHDVDMDAFIEMCKSVRNMEFYPLVDDRVAMGLVFTNVVYPKE